MAEKNLFTISEIKKRLINEYGEDNICIVNTKGFDLIKKSSGGLNGRNVWADNVVRQIYGIERSEIIKEFPRVCGSGEYQFAYVKFFKDNKKNIYGGVNGLSSFHRSYPSDVWFYPVPDESKQRVTSVMEQFHLSWYTDEILIIKNEDVKNRTEARKKESDLHNWFELED